MTLRASLSVGDRELIAYSPVRLESKPMPEAVKPPAEPKDILTIEELYLTGLWIEQFHNPISIRTHTGKRRCVAIR